MSILDRIELRGFPVCEPWGEQKEAMDGIKGYLRQMVPQLCMVNINLDR